MENDQLIPLINLLNANGIGPQKVNSLVAYFKDPTLIFHQSKSALCQVEGIDLKSAEKIIAYNNHEFGSLILDKMDRIDADIITLWDPNYPLLLKKIYDPPPVLYYLGNELNKREDCIAIVGSRTTTAYGRTSAEMITRELVSYGLTTVSGLARGIDSVVHRETVKSEGRTLAVLGSGIDIIYPAENRKLADDILEKGTVISEFPPGTKPDAGNFPQRNRIISGLSHATVVVEAGNRSGAILTALNAVDQNRDVFAVPGRISDKQSVGCLRLISHGAVPVTSPAKITELIQNRLFQPREQQQQTLELELTIEERIVIEQLSHDPLHIDNLASATGLDITRLLSLLLQLELKNAVVQMSGKQFVLA
ncbi:MAG: DNA-protecting protein DprA [Candidatus Marinimicrobia bacterium]|nr:DNA-protecting protein DprA [Candidatus Neomarinimicrobiota bacterium]